MDLGPYALFIWSSYAIVTLVIGGLTFWIIADSRRQKKLLKELEEQGITRRSASGGEVS